MTDSIQHQTAKVPQNLNRSVAPSTSSEYSKVAREFEKLFVSQIVEQMMKTVDFGSMDGGFGEEMWRSFMSNSLADKLVEQQGMGIAGNIEEMLNTYGK